jgi:6-phosphogluconate dehydrogenase
MQLGMVGLGRMGSNLVRRLQPAGHECVVYDVNEDAVKELAGEGATGTGSLEELVAALAKPRAVWVMVPAGQIAEQTVGGLGERMEAGDTIIDGGNSYYRDDIARAATLSQEGIHYVDVGTSGGVWGLERGYSLMIGGEEEVIERLGPLFAAIAPGVEAAARNRAALGSPRARSTATCIADRTAPGTS